MKFGIFYELQLPRPWVAGDELRLYQDALTQLETADRFGYDHAVRNCGVKMVEVETSDELERAVNEKTAMMLFFNDADPKGKIKIEEFVALGKKHNIPTFNDAAADVPPTENLSKYTKTGFDLVTFSGGKGLRGPQSAGLLLGRKDLIEAARLALQGVPANVACDGCPPVATLLEQYADGGGELLACPICFNARKLNEGDLAPNARLVGATPLWEWIGDGATVFSY